MTHENLDELIEEIEDNIIILKSYIESSPENTFVPLKEYCEVALNIYRLLRKKFIDNGGNPQKYDWEISDVTDRFNSVKIWSYDKIKKYIKMIEIERTTIGGMIGKENYN